MVNLNPANPLNQIDRSANIKETEDPKKLMEVCKEFESIFLGIILKEARNSQQIGGIEEKSYAREIYEQMQDEEMAKHMAKGQGIGLAQDLYKQMTQRVQRNNKNHEGLALEEE